MKADQKKTKLMLEISSSIHLIIGQLYTVFTTTSKWNAWLLLFFFCVRKSAFLSLVILVFKSVCY